MQHQLLHVTQESQDEKRTAVLPPLPPVEEQMRHPEILLSIFYGPDQYVLLFLFCKSFLRLQKRQQ